MADGTFLQVNRHQLMQPSSNWKGRSECVGGYGVRGTGYGVRGTGWELEALLTFPDPAELQLKVLVLHFVVDCVDTGQQWE